MHLEAESTDASSQPELVATLEVSFSGKTRASFWTLQPPEARLLAAAVADAVCLLLCLTQA